MLITSAHDSFIVGADIFEFTALFALEEAELAHCVVATAAVFTPWKNHLAQLLP